MFLVSGTEMVSAAIRAGTLGCLPAANARTSEILGHWLQQIGTSARIDPDAAGAAATLKDPA